MNIFEKIVKVLGDNLGYTVVLILSIILFAVYSDGLVYGLVTAASALVAYVCIVKLYNEFAAIRKPAAKKKNK